VEKLIFIRSQTRVPLTFGRPLRRKIQISKTNVLKTNDDRFYAIRSWRNNKNQHCPHVAYRIDLLRAHACGALVKDDCSLELDGSVCSEIRTNQEKCVAGKKLE